MKKNIFIAIIAVIVLVAVVGIFGASHKGGIATVSETGTMPTATTTVALGNTQNVDWNSAGISSERVAVNVIRKVSDNPARYELVRTVATSTENDGSATWVPSDKDLGANLYVEIGCTASASACRADVSSSQFAVVDSGLYLNTASAWQAIEAAANK